MKRIIPWLAVMLVITGILLTRLGSGQQEAPDASARPPSATLYAQNLTLFPGGDRALRVGFTPLGAAARLIVRFDPPRSAVSVCPLPAFDAPLPDDERCNDRIRSGVREMVASPGLRGVAVVLDGPHAVDVELVLEYEEGERDLSLAIPVMRAPPGHADCSDNLCYPFFELRPTRSGSFSASARWSGPDAELVLLQGSVLAGAKSATNIPYREPASAEGASPLRVATKLSAPGEYALTLRHTGRGSSARPLTGVVLDVSWP